MSRLREALGLPGKRLIGERWRALLATPHPHPLFVFGNQKAGTTVIAGLLAAATGLRATLDFAGTTAPRFAKLMRGETAIEDFIRRNAWAFSAPIVKDGNLTFVAERLIVHFGVKRAIFVSRDPYDNIRSILNRLKLAGDLAGLGVKRMRLNATWRAILSGDDIGLPPDHYVATLARRWLMAAEICERGGDAFVRVRYEDFLNDKTGTIHALARAFDLPISHGIAALLDRDFQRRGNPAADPREFFGPENFARIGEICGAVAARFGYQER